jgi:hypothetical protein
MGTEIHLEVGGASIDWAKNNRGNDYGMLFQESDLKRVKSDQIDYDYFIKNEEEPDQMEFAFVRSLKDIAPRLELLGFSLDSIRQSYINFVQENRDENSSAEEVMSFEELCLFLNEHPIQSLDNSYVEYNDPHHNEKIFGRFANIDSFERFPGFTPGIGHASSERSYFIDLFSFFHPLSILRILAECKSNLDVDVIWQFGPLVEAGWANMDEFYSGARRDQKFLIATEGSSDVHILKRAFNLIYPQIEDFFHFIDVSERHPFSGTGNLLKFAEGLIKIDVLNQIVFLFDNDAEGVDTYNRLSSWAIPSNMRAMVLPSLDTFRSFPCRGPEGMTTSDINGRAAAIECYLDLDIVGRPTASVIWTNYKKELDVYHGALEYKDSYTQYFMKQTKETVASGAYSVDRLRAVLDSVLLVCSEVAIVN